MARAHFLLCLPARLGVLLFSLSEFVVTGFLAALLWIAFAHNEQSAWLAHYSCYYYFI